MSSDELEKLAEEGRARKAAAASREREAWESSVSTNVHVVEWVHRVAPTSIALHGKWRLRNVEVRASWH